MARGCTLKTCFQDFPSVSKPAQMILHMILNFSLQQGQDCRSALATAAMRKEGGLLVVAVSCDLIQQR